MKILGIDFGEKKIGLALADGPLAGPLFILRGGDLLSKIKEVCLKEKIDVIVMGISEGKMALETKEFARLVSKRTGLKVEFEDETLTSKEAIVKMNEVKRNRKDEDAIAAAIILQNYIDNKCLKK